MKKALSTLIILSVLFCTIFLISGCGKSPDYAAPLEAYRAFNNGEDVVGKTVEFTVNEDSPYGKIFSGATPDFSSLVTIYITDDSADKVEYGDSIMVKISSVETSLAEVSFNGTLVD
ncbi:hypothetical protein SAMN02910456_02421 [Ruminococcaceae bacterium YRB3002]|nr:hypothetical protein SAMN02910456_02421 [Ruminococcaceae bacterium YRB3002]